MLVSAKGLAVTDAIRLRRERAGAIREVAFLVAAFTALNDEGRSELLDATACTLAERRMKAPPVASPVLDDPRDWLADLAVRTMPRDDDASRLIGFACDAEESAMSMLFPDGVLSVLLGVSSVDQLAAEGVLAAYASVRVNDDSMGLMPDAAGALGIQVARDDFERWHEDDWQVDEDAWSAEVDRRCVASVAGMLAWWRDRLFTALLDRAE